MNARRDTAGLAPARKQSGLTMIELGAGLVILAIVTAAVAPAVFKNIQTAEAVTEGKDAITLMKNMHSLKRKPPYSGISNAWAISTKAVNPSKINGSSLVNQWGASITVARATLGGGAANYALEIKNAIPIAGCLVYVSTVAPMVDEVFVGSTKVKAVGASLNDSKAATACNRTSATIVVTIRDA